MVANYRFSIPKNEESDQYKLKLNYMMGASLFYCTLLKLKRPLIAYSKCLQNPKHQYFWAYLL